MASSSADAFPRPAQLSEIEWRLHLTAVAGPFREAHGDGPRQVTAPTGAAVRVALNRSADQPVLVTVRLGGAGFVAFFGRSPGVNASNGILHSFAVDPVFRAILMPSDELYLFQAGAPTPILVREVIV